MAKGNEATRRAADTPDSLMSRRRYRRLLVRMALSICLVAVLPLLVMTLVNVYQYEEVLREERIRPMARLAAHAKYALEYFLTERQSALELAVLERPLDELLDSRQLERLLAHVKQAFGGFVDVGLIADDGRQVAYAGPFHLEGKDYKDQVWFHEAMSRGVYTSDVFRGYRNIPHFIVAVRFDPGPERSYVLRATIDTEEINRQILGFEPAAGSEAFLVNHEGVLQTPSRLFGAVLGRCPLPVPPYSPQAEVREMEGPDGEPLIVGYAYVEATPFVVFEVRSGRGLGESWMDLRSDLLLFLLISIAVIVAVTIWGSRSMVNHIREADLRRAALFHKMEYTNKMAAIGRLGAGVAHEINNPLAIINEKAGLLKDLLSLSPERPPNEKLLGLIDSVLRSVERCRDITHRLLGFAKHMDVRHEKLDLGLLIREVLSFLEKEAGYRGIDVVVDIAPDLPPIHSDRGQLQQVFLNIVNNAFAAIADGGRIEISIEPSERDTVTVRIADDGVGIPEEHLERIFEPFFTTKKGAGTGLGLSITYGIVEKLGGRIRVASKVGEGTTFTVVLPVQRDVF